MIKFDVPPAGAEAFTSIKKLAAAEMLQKSLSSLQSLVSLVC